jgi:hypothetical protein
VAGIDGQNGEAKGERGVVDEQVCEGTVTPFGCCSPSIFPASMAVSFV